MKLQEGQRVTLNPSGEYDWAGMYRSGDIRVPLTGQYGTVIEVTPTLAAVEIDKAATVVVVDRVNDPRVLVVDDQTVKLAVKLAMLCADEIGAEWPQSSRQTKANALAAARFRGACEVAFILGYGNTPTHVDLDVRDWVRNHPRPVDNSALRTDLKAWFAAVEDEVAKILAALR